MSEHEAKGHTAAEIRLIGGRAAQVWQLVPRRHKYALALAALIVIVTSAGNTALALLLGNMVDTVKRGLEDHWDRHDFFRVAWVFGGMACIYAAREMFHVLRRLLAEQACTSINRDTLTRVVSHMLKTDFHWLNQQKVGTQHGRIMRSVDALVRFVRLMFLDCMPAIFTGLFALVATVAKAPLLGLVMLGVMPLALWLTLRQLTSQKHVRLGIMHDCEQIDGTVVEQLSGAEYVRAANTYELEGHRLAHVAEARRQRELHHHWHMSLYGLGKAINENVFHLLILGLAAYLAVQQQVTCGDILVFSVLYMNVMAPLNEVHRLLDEGHEVSLRVGDLMEILEEPQDRSFAAPSTGSIRYESGRSAIRIEDLVVDYVTSDGVAHRGLNGISLEISHGESIGLVGPSGSGKSTCIKALLRLLHPKAGRIWLGNVPLEQVSRAEISEHFGYVGQNPFLFAGTIAENIAYGNGAAADAQVRQAAEYAHIHREIMKMPGGYGAVVSERGHNLSGGQRQRLAMARILLQPCPILILDEATSALDNISERLVQGALGIATADRTTLIIAHRLSTLRDCNRIFVFEHGKIVEAGTYHDLLRLEGLFTRLVRSAENGVLSESATSAPAQPKIIPLEGSGPSVDSFVFD